MSEKFTVEIITPDKSFLKSEAEEVTIPSYEGQMGILKDHISLITFLRPGFIIIKNAEQKLELIRPGLLKSLEKEHITLFPKVRKRLKNAKMIPRSYRFKGKIYQSASLKPVRNVRT